MPNQEEMREAFEREMRSLGLMDLSADLNGSYNVPCIYFAWKAWQASRRSTLEEVLPLVGQGFDEAQWCSYEQSEVKKKVDKLNAEITTQDN